MSTSAGDPTDLCSYETDGFLRLVAVSDRWTEFALENGAPHLAAPGPIGTSVRAAISDPATQYIYDELFERLATVRRPVTLGIRCDSPTRRRFVDLTIQPHNTGFTFTTSVVRTVPNPGGALLAVEAPRDLERMVRICSWCKRIDVDGEWCELESGVPRLRLFQTSIMPAITHGICEPCYKQMMTIVRHL